MVLVVEGHVGTERLLDPRADGLVALAALEQPEADEDPAGIGVDHEHRPPEGIEQDVVGRLGSDPGDGEEALTQLAGRKPGKAREPARGPEGLAQRTQSPRLDVEISRRPQRLGQLIDGQGEDGLGGQGDALGETRQRPLDVGPGGILGQDRADHDLEGRLGRPPALGAVGAQQVLEDRGQAGTIHPAIQPAISTGGLGEEGEHARVAVEPVLGDLPVGIEAYQGEVAEGGLDLLQLGGIGTEEVHAPTQTGAVDPAPRGAGEPSLECIEHPVQILARGRGIAPTEHELASVLHQIADRDQTLVGIDPHQVAYQIVPGVRAGDGQAGEDVAADAHQVTREDLADVLLEHLEGGPPVERDQDVAPRLGNGAVGTDGRAALAQPGDERAPPRRTAPRRVRPG